MAKQGGHNEVKACTRAKRSAPTAIVTNPHGQAGGQIAGNMKFADYNCPSCNHKLQAPQPSKSQVDKRGYWDGTTVCDGCSSLIYRRVYPDGSVSAQTPDKEAPHKQNLNEVTIFWLWEVEVKVRLNIEDNPLKRYTFAVPARTEFDARKLAYYEGDKKGTVRNMTLPKRIDVAFAYFPYLNNQPNATSAQRQLIWDRYQAGDILEDRAWI